MNTILIFLSTFLLLSEYGSLKQAFLNRDEYISEVSNILEELLDAGSVQAFTRYILIIYVFALAVPTMASRVISIYPFTIATVIYMGIQASSVFITLKYANDLKALANCSKLEFYGNRLSSVLSFAYLLSMLILLILTILLPTFI